MCARKSAVVNAYELVRTPTGVLVPELTANIQDHGFLRWWLDRVSERTARSLSLRNFRSARVARPVDVTAPASRSCSSPLTLAVTPTQG